VTRLCMILPCVMARPCIGEFVFRGVMLACSRIDEITCVEFVRKRHSHSICNFMAGPCSNQAIHASGPLGNPWRHRVAEQIVGFSGYFPHCVWECSRPHVTLFREIKCILHTCSTNITQSRSPCYTARCCVPEEFLSTQSVRKRM
jgi:hypothetical protein